MQVNDEPINILESVSPSAFLCLLLPREAVASGAFQCFSIKPIEYHLQLTEGGHVELSPSASTVCLFLFWCFDSIHAFTVHRSSVPWAGHAKHPRLLLLPSGWKVFQCPKAVARHFELIRAVELSTSLDHSEFLIETVDVLLSTSEERKLLQNWEAHLFLDSHWLMFTIIRSLEKRNLIFLVFCLCS